MPGIGNTVGGSVRSTDNERGAFLSGAAVCTSAVLIVGRGDGYGFTGSPTTDEAQEFNSQETTLV